jgi:hypothetical protein
MTKGYEDLEKSVRGVQYQPKANGEGGSWANITVSPGSPLFEWDSQMAARYSNTELYKPKDSERIMFATANPYVKNPNSGKSDTKLWIASMDPSDLIMKQKPSPGSMYVLITSLLCNDYLKFVASQDCVRRLWITYMIYISSWFYIIRTQPCMAT